MAYPAKTDRASVLTAALEQVENEGIENLAIRSVAAKLGLAPNAIYRYFESLAALRAAVAEEAYLRMLEMMRKAAGRKDAPEAVRAFSHAYLRYAHEQPRLFALYLTTPGADPKSPQCARNSEFFWEQVAHIYPEKHAQEASLTLWALLHGLAVLRQAGVLTEKQEARTLDLGLQMWTDAASGVRGGK
jgi:AcrR family transcriptional regulator